MRKNLWKIVLVVLCLVFIGGMEYSTHNTMAYLSAKSEAKINSFTIGNVMVSVVEEFNPPSSLVVGTNSYTKKVQVQNRGSVPAYMRVNISFSNVDVENVSMVSCDNGSHWYKLSELKEHLPEGWIYESNGILNGYYYCTTPIQPGDSTPVLITNVKTEFINKTADTNETINKTPRDYDIFVYTEGVQQAKLNGSGLNMSYSDAWTAFLSHK